MKKLLTGVTVLLVCSVGLAETPEEKLAQLEKKVEALEQQKTAAGDRKTQRENLRELKLQAIRRARTDAELYTRQELDEIEEMYRSWSKASPVKRAGILRTLVRKYPKANRTGCLWLTSAMQQQGRQKIKDLERAIRDFGDCRYLNGVQVSAYGRYLLGRELESKGRKQEAQKYFDELYESWPKAIDHSGNLLIERL